MMDELGMTGMDQELEIYTRGSLSKIEQAKIGELIRQLNSEILDRTEQLEVTRRELEALSYSISHDLRAPLRHIKGFTEILRQEIGDSIPDEAKMYLDKITSSAEKMDTLIVDLLAFTRTVDRKFSKTEFNCRAAVDDAILLLQQVISGRIIEWYIGELPEVRANFKLLCQVWTHLIENALKYTRKKEKAIIEIGSTMEKKEVIFFIKDNGVGFDMKFSGKLFGVFQRMHTQEQFEGSGIGLANVRKIISGHGGRTWAEGEVDKGAKFYFSIPA
jgi:light-regulated signal transduction histidine kinase (bacteriophytochrome)